MNTSLLWIISMLLECKTKALERATVVTRIDDESLWWMICRCTQLVIFRGHVPFPRVLTHHPTDHHYMRVKLNHSNIASRLNGTLLRCDLQPAEANDCYTLYNINRKEQLFFSSSYTYFVFVVNADCLLNSAHHTPIAVAYRARLAALGFPYTHFLLSSIEVRSRA